MGERTIADILLDSGYISGLIGKWHLGGTAKYNPIRRGFDEFFGFLHEGHYFVPPPYEGVTTWLRRKVLRGSQGLWISQDKKRLYTTQMGNTEPDDDADNPIYRDGQPVQETEYLTDVTTRESVSFIERHTDKPFFYLFLTTPYTTLLKGPTLTWKILLKSKISNDVSSRQCSPIWMIASGPF